MTTSRLFHSFLGISLLLALAMPAVAVPINPMTGEPVAGDLNLRLWLDASDGSTLWQDTAGTTAPAGGLPIARWDDKSVSGISVQQGSAGNQPTFTSAVPSLGNVPTVSFVGGAGGTALTSTTGNSTGISGNADRTVVSIWSNATNTGQNFQHTFHMGDSTANEAYGHSVSRGNGNGQIGNHYWSGGFDATSSGGLTGSNFAVSSWDGDGGTGANGLDSWWVNGAAVGASDRGSLATGTSQLHVGSRLNPFTEGFTGDLAEVLVFDTVLKTDQRNALGHYVNQKYGIAVNDAAVSTGIVFLDDFNNPNGTVIDGKAPVGGGGDWDQTVGGPVSVQNGRIDTTGGAREITGFFTDPLSAGLSLEMSFTTEEKNNFFTSGFTGFSLYVGGDEKLFVGDTNDANVGWTIADSHLGGTTQYQSTNKDTAVTGLFSYAFDSGLATLSIDGKQVAAGLLPAGAAVDRMKIWNNGGGDVILSDISVRLVPEPTTLLVWSLLAGLGVGLGWRRRK